MYINDDFFKKGKIYYNQSLGIHLQFNFEFKLIDFNYENSCEEQISYFVFYQYNVIFMSYLYKH